MRQRGLTRNRQGWEKFKGELTSRVNQRTTDKVNAQRDPNYFARNTDRGLIIGYDYQRDSREEARISEIKNPKIRPLIDELKQ